MTSWGRLNAYLLALFSETLFFSVPGQSSFEIVRAVATVQRGETIVPLVLGELYQGLTRARADGPLHGPVRVLQVCFVLFYNFLINFFLRCASLRLYRFGLECTLRGTAGLSARPEVNLSGLYRSQVISIHLVDEGRGNLARWLATRTDEDILWSWCAYHDASMVSSMAGFEHLVVLSGFHTFSAYYPRAYFCQFGRCQTSLAADPLPERFLQI